MKFVKNFLIPILVFMILVAPVLAGAKSADEGLGLVTCDNSAAKPCDWNALLGIINNVINFILWKLALPIAAIMFSYAGFLLITAGGEAAHARSKAKAIFMNTIIGICLAVGAVVIIKTLLYIVGYDGAWIGLKLKI